VEAVLLILAAFVLVLASYAPSPPLSPILVLSLTLYATLRTLSPRLYPIILIEPEFEPCGVWVSLCFFENSPVTEFANCRHRDNDNGDDDDDDDDDGSCFSDDGVSWGDDDDDKDDNDDDAVSAWSLSWVWSSCDAVYEDNDFWFNRGVDDVDDGNDDTNNVDDVDDGERECVCVCDGKCDSDCDGDFNDARALVCLCVSVSADDDNDDDDDDADEFGSLSESSYGNSRLLYDMMMIWLLLLELWCTTVMSYTQLAQQ